MPAEKNRKFFELRNGLKAVDFRNKDYFDRIDDHEKSLYSPYMLMRYASSVSSKDQFYLEHYVEMVNECVNKNLFVLSSKHKKLCWILTSMCGALKSQFHPWIKPMKRVPNKRRLRSHYFLTHLRKKKKHQRKEEGKRSTKVA